METVERSRLFVSDLGLRGITGRGAENALRIMELEGLPVLEQKPD